jgi:hypothetical protein
MSTKSAQHPHSNTPFQAHRKVILFTVTVLLVAAFAWTFVYTRLVATTPMGAKAPVISPSEATR